MKWINAVWNIYLMRDSWYPRILCLCSLNGCFLWPQRKGIFTSSQIQCGGISPQGRAFWLSTTDKAGCGEQDAQRHHCSPLTASIPASAVLCSTDDSNALQTFLNVSRRGVTKSKKFCHSSSSVSVVLSISAIFFLLSNSGFLSLSFILGT